MKSSCLPSSILSINSRFLIATPYSLMSKTSSSKQVYFFRQNISKKGKKTLCYSFRIVTADRPSSRTSTFRHPSCVGADTMAEQQQQEGSVHPPPDNPSQSQEHLHEQDGAPNTNKIDHSPRLENRSAQSSLQPMRSTKSRRRSLSRGCLDLTKVTVGVLHMIWFDLFFLLVVLGIAGAVYKWAPIWRGEGRYFPVFYDPATNSWSGPTYLSYPTAYEENKNLTFNPLPAMVPKFTVPVIKFSVALPVSVGFALLLMQIWVRSAWDKLAALAGLYKGLALT